VPNHVVSGYFYAMFIIALIATGILVFSELFVIATSPRRGLMMLLRTAPSIVLAVLNSMSLYILSVRALD
jgi:ABC-type phosphate/phosphonate transport system permease subunit